MALSIPDATEKGLEEQPVEQQKLARPKAVVSPDLLESEDENDDGPLYPLRSIPRSSGLYTPPPPRTHEEQLVLLGPKAMVVPNSDVKERPDAQTHQQTPGSVLDIRTTNSPWSDKVVSPEEGGQNLDAPGQSLEPVAKEPEAARHTPAVVEQEPGVDTGSNPDAGPAVVAYDTAAPAQDAPNIEADPDGAAQNNQQNDPHNIFICLPLGRPGG